MVVEVIITGWKSVGARYLPNGVQTQPEILAGPTLVSIEKEGGSFGAVAITGRDELSGGEVIYKVSTTTKQE